MSGDADEPHDPPLDSAAHEVGRFTSARESVRRRQEELVERRRSSPLVDAGFRVYEHNRLVGSFVLSGAVAFRLFLFLVPFVFVLVVGLGVYADVDSLEDAARQGGVSGLTAVAVADAAEESTGLQITALIVGTFAMLWAAFGLARVFRTVSALAWRCPMPRSSRPWLPPLLVIAFALSTVVGGRLLDLARDELGALGTGLTLGSVVVIVAAVLLVLVMMPHDPGARWFDLLPGAVLAGVGIHLLQLVTVYYYAAKISTLSERYGALGSAIGILGWAYAVGWLFATAGVINAVIFEMTGGKSPLDLVRRHRDVVKNGFSDDRE